MPADDTSTQPGEVLSATGQVLVPLKKTKPGKKQLAKAKKPEAEVRAERIEAVERELYQRNLEVLLDASYFGEAGDLSTVPQPWIEELGVEEATRRFKIAKAAMLAPKEAPTGLGVAKHIVSAFAKAKASAQAPRTLNVNLITVAVGPRLLPEQELEEGT
jgi:hypothetical protein